MEMIKRNKQAGGMRTEADKFSRRRRGRKGTRGGIKQLSDLLQAGRRVSFALNGNCLCARAQASYMCNKIVLYMRGKWRRRRVATNAGWVSTQLILILRFRPTACAFTEENATAAVGTQEPNSFLI